MIAQHQSPLPQETSIANAGQHATKASWQHRFMRLLPAIRRYAVIRFHPAPELRAEMVQEAIARALLSYFRLVERQKEHLARATPLARYAVAQVREGRRVGGRLNVKDVSSPYSRARSGVSLHSLEASEETAGGWREVLVEDREAGPAEIAAVRIDFSHWLSTLPSHRRHLAKRLAAGETTSDAARRFSISPGRISQIRRELWRSWHNFQGEAITDVNKDGPAMSRKLCRIGAIAKRQNLNLDAELSCIPPELVETTVA